MYSFMMYQDDVDVFIGWPNRLQSQCRDILLIQNVDSIYERIAREVLIQVSSIIAESAAPKTAQWSSWRISNIYKPLYRYFRTYIINIQLSLMSQENAGIVIDNTTVPKENGSSIQYL